MFHVKHSSPYLFFNLGTRRKPADGVMRCVYESFVPGEDCHDLGLRAKIQSAEHTPALWNASRC